MIIGPDFVWLHFPKTGGTSTEAFLRETFAGQKGVYLDAHDPKRIVWHQSINQRLADDPHFSIDSRRIISGFRRLPSWVVSRVIFEANRPPHHVATRSMIEMGEVFENNGARNTADNYLQEYQYPTVDMWVRCEHIAEDLALAFSLPLESVKRKLQSKNKTSKVSTISFWFTNDQLEMLYSCNPRWAKLERELYGSLAIP